MTMPGSGWCESPTAWLLPASSAAPALASFRGGWGSNPGGRPPSQRSQWARGLEIPAFSAGDEVLYYVGCTVSYDRRMQKVARCLVSLFQEAGGGFGPPRAGGARG